MVDNLAAIRAAVTAGRALAAEFDVCTASFYKQGDTTPVFVTPGRVKAPRPRPMDASNQAEWSTKRTLILSIPVVNPLAGQTTPDVIPKGLTVQISGADDPAINAINFTVQSALDATFAATRNVTLDTEVNATARIV